MSVSQSVRVGFVSNLGLGLLQSYVVLFNFWYVQIDP